MNKPIGLQLVVYGLLLAGLSTLAHHLAPALAQPTLIAGLAGGVLCLVWGLRALAGNRGKALPILTLIPITFAMLSQTVLTWGAGTEEVPERKTAALLITIALASSIAMLMRIAYAGMVFDGQPARAAKNEGAKPQAIGKPAAHANANKCA